MSVIGCADGDYRHTVRETKALPADCVDFMLGVDDDPDSAIFSMRLSTVRTLNWSGAGEETLHAIRRVGEGGHYLDVRSPEGVGEPKWLRLYVEPGVPLASQDGIEILPEEREGAFRPPGSPVYRHHVAALAKPGIRVDREVPAGHVRLRREPGFAGPTIFANPETLDLIADAGSSNQLVSSSLGLPDGTFPVPASSLYGGSDATADLRRVIDLGPSQVHRDVNVCCVMPGCLQDPTTEAKVGTGIFWLCDFHANMLASWDELVGDDQLSTPN